MGILELMEDQGFDLTKPSGKPAKKSTKKAPAPAKPKASKKKKAAEPEIEDEDLIDPENAELYKESVKARLRKPILEAEKLEYTNEQQKVKLEKECGNLIEYNLAEYLFFGYMDRLNMELLGLMNKIEPIIKNLTKEKNHKAIIERCNREFETILLEIKGQQSKELKKWLEENS